MPNCVIFENVDLLIHSSEGSQMRTEDTEFFSAFCNTSVAEIVSVELLAIRLNSMTVQMAGDS